MAHEELKEAVMDFCRQRTSLGEFKELVGKIVLVKTKYNSTPEVYRLVKANLSDLYLEDIDGHKDWRCLEDIQYVEEI